MRAQRVVINWDGFASAKCDLVEPWLREVTQEGLRLAAVLLTGERAAFGVVPAGGFVLEFTDEPPCTLSLNGRLAYMMDLWSRLDGEPTRFMLEAPDPEAALDRATWLYPVRIRFVEDYA